MRTKLEVKQTYISKFMEKIYAMKPKDFEEIKRGGTRSTEVIALMDMIQPITAVIDGSTPTPKLKVVPKYAQ